MIKVAVLDDYQDAFRQIVELEKYNDQYEFKIFNIPFKDEKEAACLLYTSPSPRDVEESRMPSSA